MTECQCLVQGHFGVSVKTKFRLTNLLVNNKNSSNKTHNDNRFKLLKYLPQAISSFKALTVTTGWSVNVFHQCVVIRL